MIIKRCLNCKRLFIASRSTVEYCNRIAAGEKEPCDIVGPRKVFANRLESDPALKSYNSVYRTIYSRYKRGRMSADEFDTWRDTARELLAKVRAGEMALDDFEGWLREGIRSRRKPGE